MNFFEVSWQWGYWLANSAQVAVAWRAANLEDVFQRVFGFLSPEPRSELVALLLDCAREQKRLLIDGLTTSGCPPPPGLPMPLCAGALTGIAYIKGSEGLSDFGCLAARKLGGGPPEPDRLKPSDFWVWRRGFAQRRRDWYREHFRPLLQQMSEVFGELAGRFEVLEVPASDGEDAAEAVQDLRVTAKLLALRCRQVLALYDAAAEVTEPRHRGSRTPGTRWPKRWTWCSSARCATVSRATQVGE